MQLSQITLFLFFPNANQLLKRVWDFNLEYSWKASLPSIFTLMIPIRSLMESDLCAPSLNYPHTGDIHRMPACENSPYEIVFVSRQTNTSSITILGEILEVHKENTVVIGEDEEVVRILRENEWKKSSREEMNEYRRTVGLPPHIQPR